MSAGRVVDAVALGRMQGNYILPGGLLWADGGGGPNTQDLVLVTTQGLEIFHIFPGQVCVHLGGHACVRVCVCTVVIVV